MSLNCYFGHHKCASTWIVKIVHEICMLTGQQVLEKQSNAISSYEEIFSSRKVDFYICQTSIYEKISTIKNFKGFHVIRDPRDIITSGYFSHLYSHHTEGWNALHEHKKELQKLDKREGLLKEIEFSSNFINHIIDWDYDDSRICLLYTSPSPRDRQKSRMPSSA